MISATFQLITYRCCEKTGDQTIVIPSRKINQIQEGLTRKLYYAQKTRPSLSFELFLWKCKALFLYGLCFQPRPRQKYFLHIQPNAFVIKHTQIFESMRVPFINCKSYSVHRINVVIDIVSPIFFCTLSFLVEERFSV